MLSHNPQTDDVSLAIAVGEIYRWRRWQERIWYSQLLYGHTSCRHLHLLGI